MLVHWVQIKLLCCETGIYIYLYKKKKEEAAEMQRRCLRNAAFGGSD